MDEIKVGEYVRLARCQGINKIIDIDEDGFLILDDNIADEYGDECCQISPQDADEEIVNHSFNIIDLIEIGDFVNGIKVNDISNIQGLNKTIQKCLLVNIGDGYDIINEEIKTVLTKEQYERDCYKIN